MRNTILPGWSLPALFLFVCGNSTVFAESAPLVELYTRIEAMGKEIDELRGENEELRHELDQLKQSQKQGFLAIDKRFETATSSKAAEVAPATTPAASTASPANAAETRQPQRPVVKTAAPAASTPAANNPRFEYNQAYETLKKDPKAGAAAFTAFLQKYPNQPLAENAHYWIGEAKYGQRDYKGAIDSFVVVLNKYKSGRKAPDAAVKLGYSFYALKDWNMARRTFNDVLHYFPNTNAARLAQQRLDQMKAEGH